ncbi:MAG: tetratricopeptide repeat protein, partial [Desulfobacterales bacterium]|nr:tetratricopeptide repeat protein [Desulfobacterales bacterium]
LLRVAGARGTDEELENATREFGRHALALNLLARYLRGIKGHHISNARDIPDLDIPEEKGKHPRRIMAAFEIRFGKNPETDVLRMIGLFDRPAEKGAIDAIQAGDAIPGLTERIHDLREGDRLRLLERLRATGLLARKSDHRPDALDCHPLVREHFGQKLRDDHPEAWKEAHGRLYEYYKNLPEKDLPDTLEVMEPLFAAVAHGCQAGRHQEALIDVYWERISRKGGYAVHKLGVFGSELAVLSGFFEIVWSQPASGLRDDVKAVVLNWTGFALRALGRLREAAQPMQAGLDAHINQENWVEAAKDAGNLSELYLTLGDVKQAVDYARRSVDFADQSGDAFWKEAARTTLADALHQAGDLPEAERLFQEAEAMQKER